MFKTQLTFPKKKKKKKYGRLKKIIITIITTIKKILSESTEVYKVQSCSEGPFD